MPRRRALFGRSTAKKPLTDSERIAAVAADAHLPVEDVLREVADFRLALETDMIIAAAAVDAETPELLSEVLDGERLELATFHDRLLSRLADAAADDELAERRARRTPRAGRVSRLAASAAAALAVFGAAQVMTNGRDLGANNVAAMETADQHYADFSSAVTSDSPVAVREAAQQLHKTLSKLISEHANDPEVAQEVAQLLQAEISLLRTTDLDSDSQVLAQAHRLVRLLEKAAPPQVRESVRPVLDATSPKPRPKSTPSPTATKPSTSPSPTPSPKPSATSSPESENPLRTP